MKNMKKITVWELPGGKLEGEETQSWHIPAEHAGHRIVYQDMAESVADAIKKVRAQKSYAKAWDANRPARLKNKPKFAAPKVSEVAAWLWEIVLESREYDPEEIAGEEGEPGIDVRIQIMPNGNWYGHTGDASFDQDSRGYWGSGIASPDMKKMDCREMAKEMIEQAAEMHEQDDGSWAV
jgi:hypothetical protein